MPWAWIDDEDAVDHEGWGDCGVGFPSPYGDPTGDGYGCHWYGVECEFIESAVPEHQSILAIAREMRIAKGKIQRTFTVDDEPTPKLPTWFELGWEGHGYGGLPEFGEEIRGMILWPSEQWGLGGGHLGQQFRDGDGYGDEGEDFTFER